MGAAHTKMKPNIDIEKYRKILNQESLLQTVLLQANKSNLKNITKSGLKEIQSWSFLIVKQMLTDLVQTARQSRSVAELCPVTAPIGTKRNFMAES